jgi:hypothetical protein
MKKIIISLFDYSGEWSKPYKENGFKVIQIDIKHGIDIMTWEYWEDFNSFNCLINQVRGVIAAVPCTDFALCGAASFAKKDSNGTTQKSIELAKKTMEIINYFYDLSYYYLTPFFWCIENPMTRIHKLVPEIGKLKFKFSPNEFAQYSDNPESNQYTKQTWLFGEFNNPIKKPLPSLMTGLKWKDSKRGNREKKSELRSITPDGFAKAFYEANH